MVADDITSLLVNNVNTLKDYKRRNDRAPRYATLDTTETMGKDFTVAFASSSWD